jgi:HEAT repeat protein
LGSLEGEAELEAATEGSNLDDRIEATAMLAALGAPGSITKLKALVASPDHAARARTVWAIARIHGQRLRELVYELGLKNQPDFRSMLAEKLLDPGVSRDLAVLAEMLSDQDEVTRLVAASRVLDVARFSGEARAVIAQGLGSKSDVARDLALHLATGSPSLQAALAEFIGSNDILVREAAITAAGKLRQREKFARLEPYLRDTVPLVSLAAAKALASIDPSAARPILLRGLSSDLGYVRIHCAALLLRIDREAAKPTP